MADSNLSVKLRSLGTCSCYDHIKYNNATSTMQFCEILCIGGEIRGALGALASQTLQMLIGI